MLRLDVKKDYFLIQNASDIEEALSHINQHDVISFDTETTGLNTRKDNVIGFSFTGENGKGYYFCLLEWSGDKLLPPDHNYGLFHEPHLVLLNAISKKKTVMHNASFDTRVVYHNFSVDLLTTLYSDTLLLMHTINEEGPGALKENAVLLSAELGLDGQDSANQEQLELEEDVKKRGGKWLKSDKQMYKASTHILAKYAVADVDITLRLHNYGNIRLEQQNLLDFFYKKEVMPLYKFVTIPMEFEGLYLHLELLLNSIREIKADIELAHNKVIEALMNTEEGKEFVKQRLAEEFPPKTTGNFAQELIKMFDLPFPLLASGKFQVNQKTIQSVSNSTQETDKSWQIIHFLSSGDAEQFLTKYIINEVQKRLLILKDGTEYAINISSKQQMAKIVFDLMGIESLTKTDKGAPQFNEAMVEHLAEVRGMAWAEELRVYNKLNKILGSSYQRFLDEHEDGRFYPYFKQNGTTSGRYSSNVQQLSRPLEEGSEDVRVIKYTNIIRQLFIPKPGYVFIDDDYSSLEPCVFAHDSGDIPLLDIFIKGEDFYSKVAMMALGLTDCSADKKAANFLKNLYPQHRQDAKAYSLGIRYGAEAGKISQLLHISPEEAQKLVDKYFEAFPGLKARMEDYKTQAKVTGQVISEFGRIRHLPRVKQIYDKFGDAILDYQKLGLLSRRHYIGYNDLKEIRREYKNLLNNALNFPIQSAATSIINQAMVAISMEFRERGIDGWVSACIHDQIIATVKEEQKETAAEIVQRCMETTNKIGVPLVAVPQFAYNFSEGH
jgi:DNA polymerase I-like protein with 3'-5' exonuclease and polymerase domains